MCLSDRLRLFGGLLLVLWIVPPVGWAGELDALPDSLGQWYKPANKRQVWLHTMFAMRRELQAVREYAAMGDPDRARRWGEKLAAHYRKLSEMVPEWEQDTDIALVGELLSVLDDPAATDRAAGRLANDCRSCHRQYQALAALRFRWPSFDTRTIEDGSGARVGYADFKQELSASLNRVKIAASDQRWQAAQGAAASLGEKLQLLGEGCADCHDDTAPRERVLGVELQTTLQQLDVALSAHDLKSTGRRLGQLGVHTCARCHGVHRFSSQMQQLVFD